MAKSFSKIKSTKLDLQDKIPLGKFKDCRVVDVIPDNWEYLIWANKEGLLQYTQAVIDEVHRVGSFYRAEQYYKEEIEPYLGDVPY